MAGVAACAQKHGQHRNGCAALMDQVLAGRGEIGLGEFEVSTGTQRIGALLLQDIGDGCNR